MNNHPNRSRTNRSAYSQGLCVYIENDMQRDPLWVACTYFESIPDALATAEYWGQHPSYGPYVRIAPYKDIPTQGSDRKYCDAKRVFTGRVMHPRELERIMPRGEYERGAIQPLGWNE